MLFNGELRISWRNNIMNYMDESEEDQIKEKRDKMQDLLQILLDPENQPPQFSREEAWEIFKKII